MSWTQAHGPQVPVDAFEVHCRGGECTTWFVAQHVQFAPYREGICAVVGSESVRGVHADTLDGRVVR